MRKWLRDRPWIWIVLLLGSVVVGSMIMVVIAQLNRPVIVKEAPRSSASTPAISS